MKTIKCITILTLLLFTVLSCDTANETDLKAANETENLTLAVEGKIILGKKLNNPYSVTYVKKAWESLQQKQSPFIKDVKMSFEPTHLYVKFIPKNQAELDLLKNRKDLNISDFPLGHLIVKHGHFYHDPRVSENSPTYQYTVVKKGEIPSLGIQYEVLDELIILDDLENEKKGINKYKQNFVDDLVIESYIQAGLKEYLNEDIQNVSFATSNKWLPGGGIYHYDDGYVPNQPVRIFNIFKNSHEYVNTNNLGKFSSSKKIISLVIYSIEFTAAGRTSTYRSQIIGMRNKWFIVINSSNTGSYNSQPW
jgi:hypothetical protein